MRHCRCFHGDFNLAQPPHFQTPPSTLHPPQQHYPSYLLLCGCTNMPFANFISQALATFLGWSPILLHCDTQTAPAFPLTSKQTLIHTVSKSTRQSICTCPPSPPPFLRATPVRTPLTSARQGEQHQTATLPQSCRCRLLLPPQLQVCPCWTLCATCWR
jgi:hypothetical protein